MQNGHVESFHRRLREECLRTSWFKNLFDARSKITDWRNEYNEVHPHSSLDDRPPAEFAQRGGWTYGKDAGADQQEQIPNRHWDLVFAYAAVPCGLVPSAPRDQSSASAYPITEIEPVNR
jgi:hypothetical protein